MSRLILSMFALAFSVSAAAATERDTVYRLPPLEVESARPRLDRDLALRPGFAAAYAVDSLASPTATLTELLSAAVGVTVRRFGGLGSYSAVSVRGSNANQVLFYLDGAPLQQAQYGVTNAADLPLGALERVEVYRGTAPARFADAGGGVVHLVTRAARGTRLDARASYGAFDTRQGTAWGSWAGGPARALAVYQFQGSRGGFRFLDDNGTPLNPDDDEIVERRNNAFTAHALTTKLEWAPAPAVGRVSLAADLLDKRNGLPGLSAFQAALAHFSTRRGLLSATWTSPPWAGGALEARTQLHGLSVVDEFRDRDNELGSGRQDTRDRSRAWGARQEVAVGAGPLQHGLVVVAEARREEFEPSSRLPRISEGPTSRRDALALALEERLEPWRGRLAVTGEARLERAFDDFPRGPSYAGGPVRPAQHRTHEFARRQVGLRATLPAGLTLRANAGVGHRLPALFELFGNRGTVVGNRALTPERLERRDLGLGWRGAWRGARLTAEVAAYRTDARNLILFIQNSQRTSVAQNISGARLEGIETSLGVERGGLRLEAAYTFQDTRDRSAAPHWRGRQLPGRPQHEVDFAAHWRARRWRVFHEFQYLADNYLDRANRQPLPARRLHHVGAAITGPGARLEWVGEIRNLTDERIHDVAAYPLPGRAASLTVRARL